MKPIASKRIVIRGEKWTVRVIDNESFFEQYGKDTAAITLVDKKTIDIPLQEFNFVTVLHEIFHAYSGYLHLASAEIDIHQAEEIFAELVSNYGVQMVSASTDLTAKLGTKLKLEASQLLTSLSEDQKVSVLLKTKAQKRRRKKT